MYPGVTMPKIARTAVSSWSTSPFSQGAFSLWPHGFTAEQHDPLVWPEDRIFFAGEHTDVSGSQGQGLGQGQVEAQGGEGGAYDLELLFYDIV